MGQCSSVGSGSGSVQGSPLGQAGPGVVGGCLLVGVGVRLVGYRIRGGGSVCSGVYFYWGLWSFCGRCGFLFPFIFTVVRGSFLCSRISRSFWFGGVYFLPFLGGGGYFSYLAGYKVCRWYIGSRIRGELLSFFLFLGVSRWGAGGGGGGGPMLIDGRRAGRPSSLRWSLLHASSNPCPSWETEP